MTQRGYVCFTAYAGNVTEVRQVARRQPYEVLVHAPLKLAALTMLQIEAVEDLKEKRLGALH